MPTKNSPVSFFLLRGLARERRHWGDFCDQLESASSNFRVIPLEIPGAGTRRAERSPTSVAGYIEKLRSPYLRSIQTNNTNILVGLSFGAMIAARWVHDFPTDFHGTILINASGRPSPFYERLRISAAIKVFGAVLNRNSTLREKKIAHLLCNLADPEILAESWGSISLSAPITPSNLLRQLYAAARFSIPPAVTLPTLLLCSTNDRLVNAACSHSIADTWKIKPSSHATAGHDLTTDDPHWCIGKIISWLPTVYP